MECDPKSLLQTIANSAYKNMLFKVSEKIDHWHLKQSKQNEGEFNADDEFVPIGASPSKFSSSSSEEDKEHLKD